VTYKNDLARTGQNLTESVLTPGNVKSASFGLLRSLTVDGKVDATPLYLSALTVIGAPGRTASFMPSPCRYRPEPTLTTSGSTPWM